MHKSMPHSMLQTQTHPTNSTASQLQKQTNLNLAWIYLMDYTRCQEQYLELTFYFRRNNCRHNQIYEIQETNSLDQDTRSNGKKTTFVLFNILQRINKSTSERHNIYGNISTSIRTHKHK